MKGIVEYKNIQDTKKINIDGVDYLIIVDATFKFNIFRVYYIVHEETDPQLLRIGDYCCLSVLDRSLEDIIGIIKVAYKLFGPLDRHESKNSIIETRLSDYGKGEPN